MRQPSPVKESEKRKRKLVYRQGIVHALVNERLRTKKKVASTHLNHVSKIDLSFSRLLETRVPTSIDRSHAATSLLKSRYRVHSSGSDE